MFTLYPIVKVESSAESAVVFNHLVYLDDQCPLCKEY